MIYTETEYKKEVKQFLEIRGMLAALEKNKIRVKGIQVVKNRKIKILLDGADIIFEDNIVFQRKKKLVRFHRDYSWTYMVLDAIQNDIL